MRKLLLLLILISFSAQSFTRLSVKYPDGTLGWGPLEMEDAKVEKFLTEHAFPSDYIIERVDITAEKQALRADRNAKKAVLRAGLGSAATAAQVRAAFKVLVEQLGIETADEAP